mmetsp:Transcript_40930/g.96230  ORF Transcript_40930/g.96230 Transcript_40930/m.96230 type:complete len:217 (+) Transcript_40930:81-731(+)
MLGEHRRCVPWRSLLVVIVIVVVIILVILFEVLDELLALGDQRLADGVPLTRLCSPVKDGVVSDDVLVVERLQDRHHQLVHRPLLVHHKGLESLDAEKLVCVASTKLLEQPFPLRRQLFRAGERLLSTGCLGHGVHDGAEDLRKAVSETLVVRELPPVHLHRYVVRVDALLDASAHNVLDLLLKRQHRRPILVVLVAVLLVVDLLVRGNLLVRRHH